MRIFAGFIFFALLFASGGSPTARAALPKFMGGSGIGVSGNKGNTSGEYPTFWDSLMQQQSYSNMRQGLQEMAQYKYREAAANFGKAIVKNPGEAYPHIFLGMALYWQGAVDSAMAEYKTALEMAPGNDDARLLLGIAYAWKGDIAAAQQEFQKAIEANPRRADARMNIGSTYAAQGDLEETLYHLRAAVNLDKTHPLYRYQLGAVYERLGRDAQAEEAFKRALSLYPRYEEAMLALAVLDEKLGKLSPAESNYKKALRIKPGDSIARLRLANLLAATKRKHEAVEILGRGFLISPASGEGLALSIAYSGGGAQAAAQRLEQFKNRLLKAPSSTQLVIEVEMALSPKLEAAKIEAAPPRESALANAIEQADKAARTSTFSRTFILTGAGDEERASQLERIINDFETVLKTAGGQYDVNLALRAHTPVSDNTTLAAGASVGHGPTSAMRSGGKAGYNPHMVGNDMGLWTPSKNWIMYVEEVLPAITARLSGGDARDYIVAAFAYMTLGRAAEALENFDLAAAAVGGGDLGALIALGRGTACIVQGDDAKALAHYRAALELEPDNQIAKNNIEVLTEE